MKFKDILCAVGERTDWIKICADWSLDDSCQITMSLPTNITLDSEVDVHYQWFWHCDPEIDTSEIYNAIETHDYATFTKWFEILESKFPLVYLPDYAEMWVDDKYIGSVYVTFNKQTFQLITSQDHECG